MTTRTAGDAERQARVERKALKDATKRKLRKRTGPPGKRKVAKLKAALNLQPGRKRGPRSKMERLLGLRPR